jgi:CTP-dependent riboflavin kinase
MATNTSDVIDPLVRDFVEWIGNEPRPYRDVLDAWRTSCPRLTVWEEARDRGYVERGYSQDQGAFIRITEKGRRFVTHHR